MKFHIYGIVSLCLVFTACHRTREAADPSSVIHNGDTLIVPSSSPVRANIVLESIQTSPYSLSFTTFGSVRAEAGRQAEVAVPMDGRTGKCLVRQGQMVRAGQPLFAFHSADYAEVVKSWFQARSGNNLAAHNLRRKTILHKDGVVSDRELEEAKNDAEQALRELRQAESALAVLGVDTACLLNGGDINIVAPISGEIMRCEVTDGQYVRADAEPLITIADLSRVWISAQLKEQYISRVHRDDSVTVFSDAYPDKPVCGKIVYIGGIVDDATRSVEVIVACDNPDKQLLPGMYVRATFCSQGQQVLVIPASAILQSERESYVYTALNDSTFLPAIVEVQSADEEHVVVKKGLTSGQRIVTKGGIYLID